jgi:hypothetical protein
LDPLLELPLNPVPVPMPVPVPVPVPDVPPPPTEPVGLVVDVEDPVVVEVVGAVVVVVVGGVVVLQRGEVKVSSSRLTWPFRASARPATVVSVVTVIDVNAMIVPVKVEAVPNVAELPTCQKTLQACASLMTLTLLAVAVTNVDATWKMNTALGFPWPFNVRVPLTAIELVDL